MRIWSLHPNYLDSKGLVALWRETLLAKNVLLGNTKGYKHHPQLIRFQQTTDPIKSIDYYLQIIWSVSQERGYNFDVNKFEFIQDIKKIPVKDGQIEYEFVHLLNKLKERDVIRYNLHLNIASKVLHPLFFRIEGAIENWEKL